MARANRGIFRYWPAGITCTVHYPVWPCESVTIRVETLSHHSTDSVWFMISAEWPTHQLTARTSDAQSGCRAKDRGRTHPTTGRWCHMLIACGQHLSHRPGRRFPTNACPAASARCCPHHILPNNRSDLQEAQRVGQPSAVAELFIVGVLWSAPAMARSWPEFFRFVPFGMAIHNQNFTTDANIMHALVWSASLFLRPKSLTPKLVTLLSKMHWICKTRC